jgi:hypothetical protein
MSIFSVPAPLAKALTQRGASVFLGWGKRTSTPRPSEVELDTTPGSVLHWLASAAVIDAKCAACMTARGQRAFVVHHHNPPLIRGR